MLKKEQLVASFTPNMTSNSSVIRVSPQGLPAKRAKTGEEAATEEDSRAATVRKRREALFSPHRVVLVDCDIVTRGLAPRERGATVFHELFAEVVLVEASGVPVTELLVKDSSCARLVRVTHWSSLPPPSFLVAGAVFHFVGICDSYVPLDGVEPHFICHWMALASLCSLFLPLSHALTHPCLLCCSRGCFQTNKTWSMWVPSCLVRVVQSCPQLVNPEMVTSFPPTEYLGS